MKKWISILEEKPPQKTLLNTKIVDAEQPAALLFRETMVA